ncbi:MAG: hypothetical protein MK184_11590, partial [Acidimicrobiales bacterium]|nr:hypothetical protein [Acidimicrobiales bacterium]
MAISMGVRRWVLVCLVLIGVAACGGGGSADEAAVVDGTATPSSTTDAPTPPTDAVTPTTSSTTTTGAAATTTSSTTTTGAAATTTSSTTTTGVATSTTQPADEAESADGHATDSPDLGAGQSVRDLLGIGTDVPRFQDCVRYYLPQQRIDSLQLGLAQPNSNELKMFEYCRREFLDPATNSERGDEAGADGGGGAFSSDPPEVRACARDALGDTIYDAIAWGGRSPTDADNAAMDHCFGGDSGSEPTPSSSSAGNQQGAFSSDPPEVRACARDAL